MLSCLCSNLFIGLPIHRLNEASSQNRASQAALTRNQPQRSQGDTNRADRTCLDTHPRRIGDRPIRRLILQRCRGGDDCTDQLIKDVADFNPDILGIAAYTDTMPECERILNCLSKAPIKICGGPHASARPQELLRYCDAAFAGEAEPSMRAFARSVMKCGLPSLSSLGEYPG